MASDNEACCENDPNFAVICGFLEKFGLTCGITSIDFIDLQYMLENNQEVPQELIDLHVKLLRKARKSVSSERWERAIIKLCHGFCSQDAWEIERFGYKNARLSSKLRILKELLEMQFDFNSKFKNEVNKLSAEELRSQPLGKDVHGHVYWFQSDSSCQVRVYKEDPDEETWTLLAKDREGLVTLISHLNDGKESVLNEDSNSLESEKPVVDTGQTDSDSVKDDGLEETELELEKNHENGTSDNSSAMSNDADKENTEGETFGNDLSMEKNKPEVNTSTSPVSSVGIRIKPISELISNVEVMKKLEITGVKEKYIRSDSSSSLVHHRKAVDSAGFDVHTNYLKRPIEEEEDLVEPTYVKRPRLFDRPTLLGNKKKKPYSDEEEEDQDDDGEVFDETEEPLMLVTGEGQGHDNECGNSKITEVKKISDLLQDSIQLPHETEERHMLVKEYDEAFDKSIVTPVANIGDSPIVSEIIEESVMFFYGEGNGVDCKTGNDKKDGEAKENETGQSETDSIKESGSSFDTKIVQKSEIKLGTVIDVRTNSNATSNRNPGRKSRWDIPATTPSGESQNTNQSQREEEILPNELKANTEDATDNTPKKTMFFFGPGCLQVKPTIASVNRGETEVANYTNDPSSKIRLSNNDKEDQTDCCGDFRANAEINEHKSSSSEFPRTEHEVHVAETIKVLKPDEEKTTNEISSTLTSYEKLLEKPKSKLAEGNIEKSAQKTDNVGLVKNNEILLENVSDSLEMQMASIMGETKPPSTFLHMESDFNHKPSVEPSITSITPNVSDYNPAHQISTSETPAMQPNVTTCVLLSAASEKSQSIDETSAAELRTKSSSFSSKNHTETLEKNLPGLEQNIHTRMTKKDSKIVHELIPHEKVEFRKPFDKISNTVTKLKEKPSLSFSTPKLLDMEGLQTESSPPIPLDTNNKSTLPELPKHNWETSLPIPCDDQKTSGVTFKVPELPKNNSESSSPVTLDAVNMTANDSKSCKPIPLDADNTPNISSDFSKNDPEQSLPISLGTVKTTKNDSESTSPIPLNADRTSNRTTILPELSKTDPSSSIPPVEEKTNLEPKNHSESELSSDVKTASKEKEEMTVNCTANKNVEMVAGIADDLKIDGKTETSSRKTAVSSNKSDFNNSKNKTNTSKLDQVIKSLKGETATKPKCEVRHEAVTLVSAKDSTAPIEVDAKENPTGSNKDNSETLEHAENASKGESSLQPKDEEDAFAKDFCFLPNLCKRFGENYWLEKNAKELKHNLTNTNKSSEEDKSSETTLTTDNPEASSEVVSERSPLEKSPKPKLALAAEDIESEVEEYEDNQDPIVNAIIKGVSTFVSTNKPFYDTFRPPQSHPMISLSEMLSTSAKVPTCSDNSIKKPKIPPPAKQQYKLQRASDDIGVKFPKTIDGTKHPVKSQKTSEASQSKLSKTSKITKQTMVEPKTGDNIEVHVPKTTNVAKHSNKSLKTTEDKELEIPITSKVTKQATVEEKTGDNIEVNVPKKTDVAKQPNKSQKTTEDSEVEIPNTSKVTKQTTVEENTSDNIEIHVPKKIDVAKQPNKSLKTTEDSEVEIPKTSKAIKQTTVEEKTGDAIDVPKRTDVAKQPDKSLKTTEDSEVDIPETSKVIKQTTVEEKTGDNIEVNVPKRTDVAKQPNKSQKTTEDSEVETPKTSKAIKQTTVEVKTGDVIDVPKRTDVAKQPDKSQKTTEDGEVEIPETSKVIKQTTVEETTGDNIEVNVPKRTDVAKQPNKSQKTTEDGEVGLPKISTVTKQALVEQKTGENIVVDVPKRTDVAKQLNKSQKTTKDSELETSKTSKVTNQAVKVQNTLDEIECKLPETVVIKQLCESPKTSEAIEVKLSKTSKVTKQAMEGQKTSDGIEGKLPETVVLIKQLGESPKISGASEVKVSKTSKAEEQKTVDNVEIKLLKTTDVTEQLIKSQEGEDIEGNSPKTTKLTKLPTEEQRTNDDIEAKSTKRAKLTKQAEEKQKIADDIEVKSPKTTKVTKQPTEEQRTNDNIAVKLTKMAKLTKPAMKKQETDDDVEIRSSKRATNTKQLITSQKTNENIEIGLPIATKVAKQSTNTEKTNIELTKMTEGAKLLTGKQSNDIVVKLPKSPDVTKQAISSQKSSEDIEIQSTKITDTTKQLIDKQFSKNVQVLLPKLTKITKQAMEEQKASAETDIDLPKSIKITKQRLEEPKASEIEVKLPKSIKITKQAMDQQKTTKNIEVKLPKSIKITKQLMEEQKTSDVEVKLQRSIKITKQPMEEQRTSADVEVKLPKSIKITKLPMGERKASEDIEVKLPKSIKIIKQSMQERKTSEDIEVKLPKSIKITKRSMEEQKKELNIEVKLKKTPGVTKQSLENRKITDSSENEMRPSSERVSPENEDETPVKRVTRRTRSCTVDIPEVENKSEGSLNSKTSKADASDILPTKRAKKTGTDKKSTVTPTDDVEDEEKSEQYLASKVKGKTAKNIQPVTDLSKSLFVGDTNRELRQRKVVQPIKHVMVKKTKAKKMKKKPVVKESASTKETGTKIGGAKEKAKQDGGGVNIEDIEEQIIRTEIRPSKKLKLSDSVEITIVDKNKRTTMTHNVAAEEQSKDEDTPTRVLRSSLPTNIKAMKKIVKKQVKTKKQMVNKNHNKIKEQPEKEKTNKTIAKTKEDNIEKTDKTPKTKEKKEEEETKDEVATTKEKKGEKETNDEVVKTKEKEEEETKVEVAKTKEKEEEKESKVEASKTKEGEENAETQERHLELNDEKVEANEPKCVQKKVALLTCIDINKLKAEGEETALANSLESTASPGGKVDSDRSDDVVELVPERDPFACSEKEDSPPKIVGPMTLSSFKLDHEEDLLPNASPLRVTRKRAAQHSIDVLRESRRQVEKEEEGGGKRPKLKKRSVDRNLRRSVEEQKLKEIGSSSEEDDLSGSSGDKQGGAKRNKSGGKPRISAPSVQGSESPAPSASSDDASEETSRTDTNNTPPMSKDKKKTRKTRKTLLGLEISEETENLINSSSAMGVRQSRRIAQIKIKEEADRRKLEEVTLLELKDEQRKRKGKKNDDKDYKIEKRKRNKNIPTEDETTGDAESDEKKKRKRKRKHWDPTKQFDAFKAWNSSSGSSSSEIEDEEEEIEDDDDHHFHTVLKSDHEFSPESDLEGDGEVQPLKRARTARKESDAEEEIDDCACQKCGQKDHPEWILLCDNCDSGWHCSCLRPALLVIPEGDWFCPPCQHVTLVKNLEERLLDFDRKINKREMETRRKERLAYVGISLDNVLPSKDSDEHRHKHHRHAEEEKTKVESSRDDYSGNSESDDSSSASDSSSSSDSDSEPIYQLRERRQAHSYRFNDYDELINSAIQEEIEAVKGAGNQGRGKDIATIVNAEKEKVNEMEPNRLTELPTADAAEVAPVAVDGSIGEGVLVDATLNPEATATEPPPPVVPPDYDKRNEDVVETDEEVIRPVKKIIGKKKHRKLNSLDVSSEDDAESDEDFKGSCTSGSDEEFDDEEFSGSESSDYRKGKRRKDSGPIRRSTRARTSRYDRDFINDDDSESESKSAPRRKKTRSIWDESESEESDRSWGKRKQRKSSGKKRISASKPKKSKKKKKKKAGEESDPEVFKKRPNIKFGGLNDDEEIGRRTRGKKINYLEALGTDSEEEIRRKPPRIEESEEEYNLHEDEDFKQQFEIDKDSDESGVENVLKDMGTIPKPKPRGRGKAGLKIPRKSQQNPPVDFLSSPMPNLTQTTEQPSLLPAEPLLLDPALMNPSELVQNNEIDDEPNPIEQINKNVEEMNELEMEKMMEEEDYANRQLQLVALQIEKEKKRKEREAQRLEKLIEKEQKVPKKRGRKPKNPMLNITPPNVAPPFIDSASMLMNSVMANNAELSEPPGVPLPMFTDISPVLNADGTPKKRRGRGKGKKTLAAEAAAIAAASGKDGSEIDMVLEGPASSGSNTVSPAPDSPMHGSKLGIAAPPQPFSQSQPTPSVITRMLQSQPPQGSFPPGASKYFGAPGDLQLGPPPGAGPFHPGASGPRGPYQQPPPGLPHYPVVRSGPAPPHRLHSPGPPSLPPMYHSHRSMDPSPSGGGPISVSSASRDRHSPAIVPPASNSPLNKTEPVPPPPPPPYTRPQLGHFPPTTTNPRHVSMVPQLLQQHRSGSMPPYHPGMPPNYFTSYPPPPQSMNDDGHPSPVYSSPAAYPEAYHGEGGPPSLPTEGVGGKTFDDEGGEFVGLVSYFSSQREDDLDT